MSESTVNINKNVFEKTRKKLIFSNMIGVQIFMIIFSISIYAYFATVTNKSIDNEIRAEFKNIINQFEPNENIKTIRLIDPKDLVFIYKDGAIQFYTENKYIKRIAPGVSKDLNGGFSSYIRNGYTFREMNIKSGDYQIQIIRNIDSEINALRQILIILITFGLISLVISYFIAVLLMKKSLKSIEQTWNNQVNFIQDASHELRTPVSIVQSKLEGLLKTPDMTIADRVDDIACAMVETRRLNKMIRDLLSLTKEDSIIKLNVTDFDIVELAEEVYRNYVEFAQYQEKEFKIENTTGMDEVIISNDRSKVRQILVILLDNAFKYTENGDSITIIIDKINKERFSISVKDSGIGISEKDIPFVFDRFYRSDIVRAEDVEGSGIGLSIAKILSLNIAGKLEVESKLGEGTQFKLTVNKKIK